MGAEDQAGITARDVRELHAPNGKGHVSNGKGKGKGYYKGGADYFVGVIKSFNAAKGYGMIACDQTSQMYGKDVFFSSLVLPPYLRQGSSVSFSIVLEDK